MYDGRMRGRSTRQVNLKSSGWRRCSQSPNVDGGWSFLGCSDDHQLTKVSISMVSRSHSLSEMGPQPDSLAASPTGAPGNMA